VPHSVLNVAGAPLDHPLGFVGGR